MKYIKTESKHKYTANIKHNKNWLNNITLNKTEQTNKTKHKAYANKQTIEIHYTHKTQTIKLIT